MIKNKTPQKREEPKLFLLLVLTLSLAVIPLSSATTLQDLLSSYSYDYYGDEIDISTIIDSMQDTNSNSIDDTLFFNIGVNDGETGNYIFYIDLEDSGKKLTQSKSATISSFPTPVSINFSTSLLSQNQFNYTIRVYDVSNDELVYRQDRLTTQTYGTYEEGVNLEYEINVLRQAVYEMSQETCLKDNTYSWCE